MGFLREGGNGVAEVVAEETFGDDFAFIVDEDGVGKRVAHYATPICKNRRHILLPPFRDNYISHTGASTKGHANNKQKPARP